MLDFSPLAEIAPVGTFSALSRIYTPDAQGNVSIGDNFLSSTNDTIIMNTEKDFIAVCGMKDIVVVNHDGAMIIYPKGKDYMIKELLQEIEARGKTDVL